MTSEILIKAIAVTAELCGRTFSEAAARVFVQDLERYPEEQVLGALSRCRREVRGMLTVQDVVSRLEDGRPGPEEAWAMIPRDEASTTVWTDEMTQAWGIALPLIEAGEDIPARMAFRETYTRLVLDAREAGKLVKWTASLGHDKSAREQVLFDAVEKGRLPAAQAQAILPYLDFSACTVIALRKSA